MNMKYQVGMDEGSQEGETVRMTSTRLSKMTVVFTDGSASTLSAQTTAASV